MLQRVEKVGRCDGLMVWICRGRVPVGFIRPLRAFAGSGAVSNAGRVFSFSRKRPRLGAQERIRLKIGRKCRFKASSQLDRVCEEGTELASHREGFSSSAKGMQICSCDLGGCLRKARLDKSDSQGCHPRIPRTATSWHLVDNPEQWSLCCRAPNLAQMGTTCIGS